MDKWKGFNSADKKGTLYLLSLVIGIGYIIDIFSLDNVVLKNLNIIALLITAVSLIFSLKESVLDRVFQIVVYTLLLCVVATSFLKANHIVDDEMYFSAAVIGALIPITGFVLGKKHTIFLGSFLLLFVFSAFANSRDYCVAHDRCLLIIILLIGYTYGMYYLISLIEKGAVNRKVLFGRLEQQNRDNLFVNSLAMELMASQAADDIAPLLLNKIKSYTDAGFAIFSVYDPLQKCMLVKHIDAEDSIIKTIEKVVEEDMLKVRIPVDDATRQMMLNEKIGISQSFADITFGAVSSTDNTAIKCQTGLHTFIGIVHEVSNQLYATTLIGLRQKYDLPAIATLKSYSYVASLTLKRNITELALQESESKLKCLIADKDRYMQIISHDLRSPFQSLMGFSEILVNSLNDCSSEEIRDGLMIINQTSQNTYNLFEDLLLWSKAQSGKLILEHGSFLLKELCDSIIEVLRFNAEQKGLTIVNKVPELFRIWADSNVLKTVLRNLISNAIKFSNHDSDVLVTAEVADGSVIVGISDWGVGISVERQQNIWDDNLLTTTSGTGNEQGTGTGLLLCKELIEKHGGKIWVESRINNGSTFKISIPNLT